MMGWWVCRWANERDDERGWRPIEFGQIVGDAPLPGRYIVKMWGSPEERYWHRATILRKWPFHDEARAHLAAIRGAEAMAMRSPFASIEDRECDRDNVVVELLTGQINLKG